MSLRSLLTICAVLASIPALGMAAADVRVNRRPSRAHGRCRSRPSPPP